LPQWNCACTNCLASRAGKIAPQTQSSLAVSSNDDHWFLINASPDLAQQIESAPELRPRPASARNNPIAGVLLTNADLDHALGLLLMRQQESPLVVYASAETKSALCWIERILERFCGIEWRTPGRDLVSLNEGLAFRAIELDKSLAIQLLDQSSGATVLVAPAVGEISSELRHALIHSAVILFDGTFWRDDELRAIRPGARTAREMNHLPISDGSLNLLRESPARRKIYTHINNTNPIFMPGSCERMQVEDAGIEVARDGLEVVL
jgi:pyrroloquinoline quinone biosynthesis protein B